MSAADRIEAIASRLSPIYRTHPNEIACLRAIAAELRGAPSLTEAEAEVQEIGAALVSQYVWSTARPEPYQDNDKYVARAFDALKRLAASMRALRTERTPS